MANSNIGNLDGLVALGNDGVDIQPTLLRVMTDLYVQKPTHSAEEETHYTELALRLIDLVDAATRSSVAERLVSYPAAPQSVLQRLARDAVGPDLRPEFDAPAVFQAVPAPMPVPRPRSDAEEMSELFLSADVEERRLILVNLEYAPATPAAPLAPQAARDSIRRFETAALAHNSESFAQEIERTFAISRTHARRLVEDATGEPILVIARALSMPADVLQRILLCLNPDISRSVQRVYELAMLYEEIPPVAALHLVAIWRAMSKPVARAPVHQPQYVPEATKARHEPAARPIIRWDEYGRQMKAEGSSS